MVNFHEQLLFSSLPVLDFVTSINTMLHDFIIHYYKRYLIKQTITTIVLLFPAYEK